MMFHSHHPPPSFHPSLRPQQSVYPCCLTLNPAIPFIGGFRLYNTFRDSVLACERASDIISPNLPGRFLMFFGSIRVLLCHGCTHVMTIDISSVDIKTDCPLRKSLLFTNTTPLYTYYSSYFLPCLLASRLVLQHS